MLFCTGVAGAVNCTHLSISLLTAPSSASFLVENLQSSPVACNLKSVLCPQSVASHSSLWSPLSRTHSSTFSGLMSAWMIRQRLCRKCSPASTCGSHTAPQVSSTMEGDGDVQAPCMNLIRVQLGGPACLAQGVWGPIRRVPKCQHDGRARRAGNRTEEALQLQIRIFS